MIKMSSGLIYKGYFKDDKKCGLGLCMFPSGALYKGNWKDDVPSGHGILYSGKNEILEASF
jgi:lysozyme